MREDNLTEGNHREYIGFTVLGIGEQNSKGQLH